MANHTVDCDFCGKDLRGLGGGHDKDCPVNKSKERLCAEIARLTAERDRQYDENVHRIAEQTKAETRAEKAEAALKEERDTSALVFEDTANIVAKLKAALSESQALLAMAFEVAASQADDDDPSIWSYSTGNRARHGESELGRHIRALTPADAQAALDARDKAKIEEGRVLGLREAAEICEVDDTAWDWDECRIAILAKIKEAENG